MGVSTDASIAYGVDLGEDLDLEALDLTEAELEDPYPNEILEERLTAHLEDPYPDWYWNEYPTPREDASRHDRWRKDHVDDLKAYYDAKKAAIDAFPFEFETHCSNDYPMHMLIARGSLTTASRGYPKPITPEEIADLPPAWPLDELFKVFDIRPALRESILDEEVDLEAPQWLLFSYWG